MLAKDKFSQHLPISVEGYHFIGEITTYIPYYKINIEVLARTEVALSFIHETILSLVSSGIDGIDGICDWLGLDQNVAAEIISDMAAEYKTLYTTGISVSLTPTGKNAMSKLKNTIYKKSEMNGLYINGITGEVSGEAPRGFVNRVPLTYPQMAVCFDVSIGLLNSKYDRIKEIYEEDRSDYLLDNVQNISLHRILSINNQSVIFAPERANLYIHSDNRNILVVYKDTGKAMYSSVVHQQIQQKVPEIRWLFEYDEANIRKWERPHWNQDDDNASLARLIDSYYSLEKGEVTSAEYDALYFRNRTALPGEVEDLLQSIDYFKTKRLVIVSSHILKYLTNQIIKDRITSQVDKTEIVIYYPAAESNSIKRMVEKEIEYLKSQIPDVSNRVRFVETDDRWDRTLIICDPGFLATTTYDYVVSSDGDMFLQETSTVHFSPAEVSYFAKLIEEYEQQHSVVKPND